MNYGLVPCKWACPLRFTETVVAVAEPLERTFATGFCGRQLPGQVPKASFSSLHPAGCSVWRGLQGFSPWR